MVDHYSSDDGVVWLYDPELDGDLHAPATRRPTEVFAVLDEVIAEAGMNDVVVTGAVQGLRRRARWWGFDLVEMSAGGDAPAATLRCVVFARQMSSIEADLAAAGTALADGAAATVTGTLGTNAAWGEVRVVTSGIVIHSERSPAARARERLVERLMASGNAAAQRRLRLPDRPRRIGVLSGAGTAGGADFDRLLEASGLDWEVVRRAVPMAGPHAPDAVAGRTARRWRGSIGVLGERRGRRRRTSAVGDEVGDRAVARTSSSWRGEADAERRRWAATSTAHAAAMAGMAARVRVAWIVVAVVLLVLVAVVVGGLAR